MSFFLRKCLFKKMMEIALLCDRTLTISSWWSCYPTPSEGWGHRETLQKPISWTTPQGSDHRSKMEEVVPKMARRKLRCRAIQKEVS